ncbi:MAG: cytidylate kinase-like family protein, partial [Oscillospiraceae bacterium]
DESEQGSIIYSLLMGTYSLGDGGRVYPELPLNYKIFLAQFDAIKGIAEEGPCVIVGRCADYVLAGRNNLMSVFISSDIKARIERVRQRHPEVQEKKLEEYIKKIDKKRSGYYYYFTDRKWGVAANYDFCIKSSRLGAEKTAEVIARLAEASD